MLLSLLAARDDWKKLADWLLKQSSTFGLRYRVWDRLKLARKFEEREVSGHLIKYKLGFTTDGQFVKEKAEFEDLRRVWDKNS